MSVEKVSDYLERKAKATFRKGYEEVLPLSRNFARLVRLLALKILSVSVPTTELKGFILKKSI